MSYPDSVRYLYSLGNELKSGAKWNLERMHALLSGLGHPERGQRFIHVAGTNGKGSTCAMLASILKEAGLRAGLYTSPHLIEPTERIQIDGRPVTAEEFAEAFQTVHEVAERLLEHEQIDAHPSYFETVTAMALIIFRPRCDIAVIEVGLGGRLDATNVISPELCVITPIAYDHEAFLGNTLQSIAAEKAGILKQRVPLVLAGQAAEAGRVIVDRAHNLACEIIDAASVPLDGLEVTARGSAFSLDGVRYKIALAGRHQIDNAKVAVLASRYLGLDVAAIQSGLQQTCWPGRIEFVRSHPDFVLDGAHNPAAAGALAAYIREFCSSRPVWLVYGAMRDKAIEEVTAHLFPLADRLIVTAPDFPRALRPEAILAVTGHPHAAVAETIQEAIYIANSAPRDAIVFFTGSLFVVGEARALLTREPAVVS